MTDKIVVLSACASPAEAEGIARALVEKRLAACVNVLPAMRSVYRWKDAVENEQETLLIIKSSRGLFDALRAEIEKMHSYETPEVIALPIVAGAEGYLEWMGRVLGEDPDP